MLTVNKVTIMGYVGKDPACFTFPSGNQCANFNVATSDSWIDKKTGEKKEVTEWHRVVSFVSVNFIKENIHTGDPVYLEGSIRKREYIDNNTGEKKQITEIIISPYNGKVNKLDSSKKEISEPDEPLIPPPVIDDFPKSYKTEEL